MVLNTRIENTYTQKMYSCFQNIILYNQKTTLCYSWTLFGTTKHSEMHDWNFIAPTTSYFLLIYF